MLNSIPNVTFKSNDGSSSIEFLKLSELFERFDRVLHNPRKPHRLMFFALLIVTKGEGKHQVDLKEYSLKKGSVIKIAKGQVHAFDEQSKYDGYLVVFTEEFVLKYFSQTSIIYITHLYNYHISEPLIPYSTSNSVFLEQVNKELQNKEQYLQNNIIAKMLELYLLRLERQASYTIPIVHNDRSYALFLKFKDLVKRHYSKTRNVKDYALWLNVSVNSLNKAVKNITHNTAKIFIDQYVILEAKRAILSTDNSLKEVAYQTGFDEVTNFTKFFKKHTSLSPKNFRASI